MATTYNKDLKRGQDGRFYRNIGSYEGKAIKLLLGFEAAEAQRRLSLILTVYSDVCGQWTAEALAAAKQIAKGNYEVPKLDGELVHEYAARVGKLRQTEPLVVPSLPRQYEAGVENLGKMLHKTKDRLATAVGIPAANITGFSFAKVLSDFESHIKTRYATAEGGINPTGKTVLDQLKSLKTYFAPFMSLDMGELNFSKLDDMVTLFRKRPLVKKNGDKRRMAPKTAHHLISLFVRFLRWVDQRDQYNWRLPRQFSQLDKTIDAASNGEAGGKKRTKKLQTIPFDHLKTIAINATPLERLWLLLGLNCAFGAGEIGQLHKEYIDLDRGEIDGYRVKTLRFDTEMKSKLWPKTLEGIRWYAAQRPRPASKEYAETFFLTSVGKPFWRYTTDGNVSNKIANEWNKLITRIKAKDPSFPAYSFGKLRKTAATNVRRIAGGEAASMALAHKNPTEDKLLEDYASMPWNILFDATDKLGEEWKELLDLFPTFTGEYRRGVIPEIPDDLTFE